MPCRLHDVLLADFLDLLGTLHSLVGESADFVGHIHAVVALDILRRGHEFSFVPTRPKTSSGKTVPW